MYLADRDILARLADFSFVSEDEGQPFVPEDQVGPASVDLRLSSVYWKQRRWRWRTQIIDLSHASVMDAAPRRGWLRRRLGHGEAITLAPGEMVLARTAERFCVPPDCAGAIEGRSSYARLGLAVHASGGFINPGWEGHMPLTLVNHSSASLRLPRLSPVCQLMLVPLSRPPSQDYRARGGKYLNDDGGPSYWWRDELVRRLDKAGGGGLIGRTYRELDELVTVTEPLLERSERYFYRRIKEATFGSVDEMLDGLAHAERRSQMIWRGTHMALPAIMGAVLAVIAGWQLPGAWRLAALLGVAAAIGVPAIFSQQEGDKHFLTPDRLESARSAPSTGAP